MKWFRMYHSVVDSVKVRALPERGQLIYLYLLCLASEYREKTSTNTGATGVDTSRAAWRLREPMLSRYLPAIEREGLVTVDGDGMIHVTDWEKRQKPSDDTAPRKRRSRDRDRDVSRDRHALDTDTDTEKKEKQNIRETSVGGAAPKASAAPPPAPEKVTPIGRRLPRDWKLPKGWGMWAIEERRTWTDDEVRAVAAQFRDHWCAKAGKEARKTDWKATWRNWVRDPKSTRFVAEMRKGAALAPNLSPAGQQTAANLQRWLNDHPDEGGPNGTEGP